MTAVNIEINEELLELQAIQAAVEKLDYAKRKVIPNVDDFEEDGVKYRFLPFSFESFDSYKEWEEDRVANDKPIYFHNYYISEDSFDKDNKRMFFIMWVALPEDEYNAMVQPVPELFTAEDVEVSRKYDKSWRKWLKDLLKRWFKRS